MIVYDAFGNALTLMEEVGRGRDAVLYRVQGRPEQLAKLYHAYQEEYEAKLRWMMAHPPALADPSLVSVAWPQSLLYSARARFAGFLMARLHPAYPLETLWKPRHESAQHDAPTRKELHQAAHHLACGVAAVHAQGYALGTLSPTEVLVLPPAGIMLIDVDGYQVRVPQLVGSALYLALGGHPDYTPPEWQGRIPLAELTPSHDTFALAVLIFQILLEGYHPFEGWWSKKGASAPLVERIVRGWYPHARVPIVPLRPPSEMLPLEILHPSLVALFERCFVEGHAEPLLRPTATEWALVLERAEQALVRCDQGHYHDNDLRNCPECQRAADVRAASLIVPPPTPFYSPSPVYKPPPHPFFSPYYRPQKVDDRDAIAVLIGLGVFIFLFLFGILYFLG